MKVRSLAKKLLLFTSRNYIMVETRNSKLKKNVEKSGSKRNAIEPSTQPAKRVRKSKETISNNITVRSDSIVTNIKPTLSSIQAQLAAHASKKRVAILMKFFRVEEYGRGDIFLGLKVPDIRSISKSLGFLP